MKGDFTRETFDPARHYSRVLMQQGRVTLEADHNEQTSALLHYLRTLARDLIGPYAAPIENGGFILTGDPDGKLHIGAGRYYVDGILVENETDCLYTEQPDYPLPPNDPLIDFKAINNKVFWMYLDVWERHITYLQDDDIREDALDGPDTCTRAKVVWQVKSQLTNLTPADEDKVTEQTCETPLADLHSLSQAFMSARVDPGAQFQDACVTSPDSKYRGNGNQLYRVEIHDGSSAPGGPTFKWSRENGSVVAAWLGTMDLDGKTALQVAPARGFSAGNWVEISDDVAELHGLPGVLFDLAKVEGDALSLVAGSTATPDFSNLVNPTIRRWDQTENDTIKLVNGVIPLKETSEANPLWIDLEDGVQVQFSAGGVYRTGDYWLIPARVATGDVEWPSVLDATNKVVPEPLPPDGIEHHYSPLGYLSWQDLKFHKSTCRCEFKPLSSCFQTAGASGPVDTPKPVRPRALTPAPEVTLRKRRK